MTAQPSTASEDRKSAEKQGCSHAAVTATPFLPEQAKCRCTAASTKQKCVLIMSTHVSMKLRVMAGFKWPPLKPAARYTSMKIVNPNLRQQAGLSPKLTKLSLHVGQLCARVRWSCSGAGSQICRTTSSTTRDQAQAEGMAAQETSPCGDCQHARLIQKAVHWNGCRHSHPRQMRRETLATGQ